MTLPEGPRQPPFVQLAQWIWRPFTFLDGCARRYGDMFSLHLTGFGRMVMVSSPELIKEVFTAKVSTLHAGRANELLRPVVGDRSIFLLDGEEHLRERRLLVPPFHGERMQAYAALMRDLTGAALERWPVGQPFPFHREVQAITLGVILRAVFGLAEGEETRRLEEPIGRLLGYSRPAFAYAPASLRRDFPLSPYRTFLRLKEAVDRPLFEIIAERRRAPGEGRTDILSLLLAARDEQGRGLTDQELRDELITLLLAGHETTATALSWAVERILAHPQVHERLQAELEAVLGGGRLEPHHLPRLEYLDAIIKESLRLRPILGVVARVVMEEMTLGGRPIPPGILLLACIYLAHRRPQTYPEPESFRPERFLGVKPDPYAWLPFGGGARRCIGMAFVLYEMKIVLATILSQARFRLASPGGERPVRRHLLFAPEHGTRVILTERLARPEGIRTTG